jgi:ParB/RepB/Spo0J family partition protein
MAVRTAQRGGAPVPRRRAAHMKVRSIPVDLIRPEVGLGRKRDREGHRELCRSIEQFGVLTPITVRRAPDRSGEYLLIKGQGRTLACRILGIAKVPAVVVADHFDDAEKVQQFLVENVARLRMRPVDRALLIAHARRDEEETAEVAARFGVSPATVRRLEAQLSGASHGEVEALRAGEINLALHAVIARHVASSERAHVIRRVSRFGIRAREMEDLFVALGWRDLSELGPAHRTQRVLLLEWACETLASLPRSQPRERLRQLALRLPMEMESMRARVVGLNAAD